LIVGAASTLGPKGLPLGVLCCSILFALVFDSRLFLQMMKVKIWQILVRFAGGVIGWYILWSFFSTKGDWRSILALICYLIVLPALFFDPSLRKGGSKRE
jgi:hypothetical protein